MGDKPGVDLEGQQVTAGGVAEDVTCLRSACSVAV